MGNLFASCKGDKDEKLKLKQEIVSLNDKFEKTKKIVDNLKKSNDEKYNKIVELKNAVKTLNHTITRYNNVLNKHKIVADAILKSDLNCEWMSNEKEREYLISVIKFVNVACDDITYRV